MESASDGCVIMTTTGDPEEADRLAEGLVRQGMAACVQVAAVSSCYVWEGKLERQSEQLLLIKTTAGQHAAVEAYLRRNHSYSVPEIAVLLMTGGSADYLAWLRQNSRGLPSEAAKP